MTTSVQAQGLRRDLLSRARLYFVVDARAGSGDPRPIVAAALEGGVDIVQLREKDMPDSEVLSCASSLRELCREHDALFILNDRPDLAVASHADGVHVGQEDTAVAEARAVVGDDALIGLSTHSAEQIAAAEGVDYISVGPVWSTPTKPGRPAVGLELVAHAAANAETPFFAIGGIDPTNAPEVLKAGATRLAVVRAIRDAPDPTEAAARLRASLDAVAAGSR